MEEFDRLMASTICSSTGLARLRDWQCVLVCACVQCPCMWDYVRTSVVMYLYDPPFPDVQQTIYAGFFFSEQNSKFKVLRMINTWCTVNVKIAYLYFDTLLLGKYFPVYCLLL